MADFVDCLGLAELIEKCGLDPKQNFEAIYSHLYSAGATAPLEELDHAVRAYFGSLHLPDEPTLYDHLILSLRPKDLILTFNWDPLLIQAYKRWRHLGRVLPELAFLHGNVDVGIDGQQKVFGFLSDEPYPGRTLIPTQLLYPIEKKDYNADPFIEDQWHRATNYLAEAYYVTIFGYSAPASDVEARELLLNAWRNNPTHQLAQFSIIDIREPEEVEASWTDFIIRTHGGATKDFKWNILMRHPRRSCEAFAFATLQQDPWREDAFPESRSLGELEDWVRPLLAEEEAEQFAGKPHH